jgi:HK97 family phage major capsid protein
VSIVTFPANKFATIIQNNTQNNLMNKEKNMNLETINTEINTLKSTVEKLQTVIERPEITSHHTSSMDSFMRHSIQSEEKKSFSSDDADTGAMLITPEKYHQIINAIASYSPIRRLASVDTISSNALDVVISNALFDSGWVGESEGRADTKNPHLIQKRIHVHELYAQPKTTQRLLDDTFINIESWLTARIVESFAAAENASFVLGDGRSKPTGILNYRDDIIERIEARNVDKVLVDDLLNLINSMREEYISNATMIMNRRTISEIQKIRDDNGRFIWQPSMSDKLPATIFGIPVVCVNDIPTIHPKTDTIVIADFKSGYKIVDRKDISIMKDPYTDKPFVKFYATKRVGGDVVNPNAIKILRMPPS